MEHFCLECHGPVTEDEEYCLTCRHRRKARRKEARKRARAIEQRLALMKERKLELGLRFDFDINDFRALKERFNNRCALQGRTNC